MRMIQHNKPCIGKEEADAVRKVLQSGWIIAGKEVETFENNFKKYIGMPYAVAVNSGTSALHLSLRALGVKKGDEVIVPTYTASDILNVILYVAATPVLVDIGKDTCVIDVVKVERKITKKTKAMILPHMFGVAANIPYLRHYHIPIIEDCAQAIGTLLNNTMVGTFGDISIFSFYATKLLTTGQGGMVLTNKKDLYAFIQDAIDYNGRDTYAVRYNYPLTDIAASIGNVQLKKYPEFAKNRKKIQHAYQRVLAKKNVLFLPSSEDKDTTPFRFLFQVPGSVGVHVLQKEFEKRNIEVRQPVHPYELLHRLLGQDKKDFPNAEKFAQTMLSLPLYPDLTTNECAYIASVLDQLL